MFFVKKNSKYFIKNTESYQYNTRNKNQLQPSAHKTSKFECSSSYAGALLYNKLPKELIAEEKHQIFRHKLKKFLLSKAYYNVDEFLNDTIVI